MAKKDNREETSEVVDAPKTIEKKFPNGFETQSVKITDSPYHKKGAVVKMGKSVAQKMLKRGWAETLVIAFFILVAYLPVKAQSQSEVFVNAGFPTFTSDTVTNTGTAVLVSPAISGGGTSTTIIVKVIEISGTTGGTFLLEGCLTCDGNDWATVNTPGTVTSSGSHTIEDVASQAHSWWFPGSPYRKWRVTHKGAGTMSARDFATIVKK